MSEDKSKPTQIIGLYKVDGTLGNLNTPGAPIMHFSLLVCPSTYSVSGVVEITQALGPKYPPIVIKNVTGTIRSAGFGAVTKVVALEGQYLVSVAPPAIGTYLANFSAHMAIDNDWNGMGGFTYENNVIDNVPVEKAD